MFTSKFKSAYRALLGIVVVFALGSCISNDLPYPWVQPVFKSIEVQTTDADGHNLLAAPVVIDSAARSVTIYLTEYADIHNVRITGWTLSKGSEFVDVKVFESPLDLSAPVDVTLSMYDRTFVWSVSAVQTIERDFVISSQVGSAQFDVENHTVKALVPMEQPLDNITVRSIKLAGPLAFMEPDLNGKTVDFSKPVTVEVKEFGEVTPWVITVEQTEVSVVVDRVDAWTQVAWVYGSAEAGKNNGFEYRLASSADWIAVPEDWMTRNGGSFSACLQHLDAESQYIVRAFSDQDHSAEIAFTTGSIVQLPNSDFTEWWKDGRVWNPWSEGGERFWDTGNRGAATLGQSNSVPMESAFSPTGYAGAVLETRFIGVSVLGKLGAGNLFAGKYVRTDGTNGVLSFGREFTQRPTAVKARLKYKTAAISHASKSNPDFQYMLGEPDTCIVWCSLLDCDEPFEARTKPSDRQLFNRNESYVIAYGDFQSGKSIDDYVDVVIRLDYRATDRVPKWLLLTASASKYGDYFTGGAGATLYIERYELLYDY